MASGVGVLVHFSGLSCISVGFLILVRCRGHRWVWTSHGEASLKLGSTRV